MKSRVRKAPVSNRFDTVIVTDVRVKTPVAMVTLEDPSKPPTLARGAFARLRPPEGATADEVDAWRASVALVAKAVRVLPMQHAADIPSDSARVENGEKIGTLREEAMILAAETDNPQVVGLTTQILDEVGIR